MIESLFMFTPLVIVPQQDEYGGQTAGFRKTPGRSERWAPSVAAGTQMSRG